MEDPPLPKTVSRVRQVLRRVPIVLIALAGVAFSILLLSLPVLPGERSVSLKAGDIASDDILAPRAVTYISDTLTTESRALAASSIAPVYDPPDPAIARHQAQTLRAVLATISNIRIDQFATPGEKLRSVENIGSVSLSTQAANDVLQLPESEWNLVAAESANVLERVMRQEIRPDNLTNVQSSLPAAVSFNLTVQQASLAVDLVRALVVPNSLYNAAETQILRDKAALATLPVTRTFAEGQVVIPRGKMITAEDLEALQALGLTTDSFSLRAAISMSLAVCLSATLLILFLARFHPEIGGSVRKTLLLTLLTTLFLVAARVLVPGHTVLPFILPIPSLGLVTASLFGPGLGILIAMLFSALAGLIGGNSLELTLYSGLGSLAAILIVGRGEKPLRFFAAGLAAGFAGTAVILITRLHEPASDLLGILTLSAASFANGLLSASLAIGLLFLIGVLFDITTNLQLLDLSRPDHPILREILLNAPGTYQHSLQVANLAEYAGEKIGANALLLRVGALYHDSGKAMNPNFFVENQAPDSNPHDRLDPISSARLILQHTRDGLDLARKYRLPTAIRDLIVEHHGTLRTNFQYGRALKAAGGDPATVDESLFRYPGPRPHTREAAILMLADGVEAKFRAVNPTTPEDIDTLVRSVVEDRVAQHQFDETDLSLHDLEKIRKAFGGALRGRIHIRLSYPEDEKNTDPDAPAPRQ